MLIAFYFKKKTIARNAGRLCVFYTIFTVQKLKGTRGAQTDKLKRIL